MKRNANIIQWLFLGLVLASLWACTKAGENSTETTRNVRLSSLVAGESAQLSPGEKVEPKEDGTEIEIVHVLDDDTKVVHVISGKVQLSNLLTQ